MQNTELWRQLPDLLQAHGRLVLATIIRGWGSIPREVGAKMVVLPDQSIRGTVGGGCGEAEVWQAAIDMLEQPVQSRPSVVHVDLTEDFESDNGKVCGGRFDVLLDLLEAPSNPELVSGLRQRFQLSKPFFVLRGLGPMAPPHWKKSPPPTTIPEQGWIGWQLWDGFDVLPSPLQAHQAPLTQAAQKALADTTPRLVIVDENGHKRDHGSGYFLDCALQQLHLVIAGAGHIARPLCEMATMCGYWVTIVDDRPEYAQEGLFPKAQRVICQDFGAFFDTLSIHSTTSVVLVTRGHKHDQDCLWKLRDRPAGYIGMIGSKRRVQAVLQDFQEKCSPEWLARIRAPIGLKIGAQTPEEIAICILAEMIGLRRGALDPEARLW